MEFALQSNSKTDIISVNRDGSTFKFTHVFSHSKTNFHKKGPCIIHTID